MTYPLTLALGYLDLTLGSGGRGNSFLLVARKPR
jgi:hypothetical protein